MKVFISQPMRDKTEKEILKERNIAINKLKDRYGNDIEIIYSYFEDYNPDKGCIPLKYLSKSLELLADADLACFIGDWRKARGCVIEYDCAVAYRINTVTDKELSHD